ncbi:putative acylesterase/phospholipase RssA [Flavobacterium sp. HSC-32F16]|uniref:patatin-like phospholipase family protein n=1 Tax=Flavobacterium sp. HSC-32F16 TaxID=2910964 RepID=UPI0020A47462|nr:patatin-like phospholipase family protein [Flavobacterium sp. HSC-32F16]MCP2025431.1 putative acylesterase/phospholipase RssA [Flavobacterium sp. HSC-32F16]
MSKIIILTVDGGGIKGIIPSYFLSQIEAALNKSCYEMFDIIGGTSTGGIIATALSSPVNGTQPLTASQIYEIYTSDGAQIFVPQPSFVPDYYSNYYANDGNGNGVEPFLQQKYGNHTLNDARQNMENLANGRIKHVFTTSYTINSSGDSIPNPTLGQDYGPYLFNWLDAKNAADNYQVWEAARATSAAPTYFPVAKLGGGGAPNSDASQRWALDGGVMSNNPAVWAVSEAFRTGLASSLNDIILISLGTGSYPSGAGLVTNHQGAPDPDYGNWGFTPWLASDLDDLSGTENGRGAIVNIITESVQLVSSQQLTGLQSGGLTYFRLEPSITRAQSKMDNIEQSNVDSLIDTATNYLNNEGSDIFLDIVNVLKQNI